AIVRHKAGELPLEVKLDASMGMMPQMSLAKFKQVILLARISASGNAMPQAGDMIGQTQPLEWQKLEQAVNIVINQQR
ncbi:MAG: c-type cytochrome biogenesis protein CcmI, partial [Gammaproteobacteria bacterium]|nr:c-type cytochrome biogenesis protein CcmI [Gammaproteobacteria bacterium]